MAKTLEKETVAAIEQAILTAQKNGRQPDLHAIATIFSTTYQSVCYIRRRIEKQQRTGIDERKKSGRKPMIEQDLMIAAILDLLQEKPELDQSAVSDHLFEQFGKRLCQATISRIYKKNGIPHKISNKLYKKSRLFTTHPEGQVLTKDTSREIAANALSSLPMALGATVGAMAETLPVGAYQRRRTQDDSGLVSNAAFEVLPVTSPTSLGFIGSYIPPETASGMVYGSAFFGSRNGAPYKSPYA